MASAAFWGRCVPLALDNVDTDQIIPARYCRTSDVRELGAGAFGNWRDPAQERPAEFVVDEARYAGATVLVASRNFGCGSSREHAVWALQGCGFRAVVAPSFGDIFRQNAGKNGLLPLLVHPADGRALLERAGSEEPLEVRIDVERQVIETAMFMVPFSLDAFARECFVRGVDQLGLLLGQDAAIRRYELAHPGASACVEAARAEAALTEGVGR